jgi:hypothetical protein
LAKATEKVATKVHSKDLLADIRKGGALAKAAKQDVAKIVNNAVNDQIAKGAINESEGGDAKSAIFKAVVKSAPKKGTKAAADDSAASLKEKMQQELLTSPAALASMQKRRAAVQSDDEFSD